MPFLLGNFGALCEPAAHAGNPARRGIYSSHMTLTGTADPDHLLIERLRAYPRSIVAAENARVFLARDAGRKTLGVWSADAALLDRFDGTAEPAPVAGSGAAMKLGPLSAANAAALRALVPWLAPRAIGRRQSAGCGDRLGLATPGHIRAFRRSGMAPVLAQQSMRENARTGRTPQQVIDDAMWGVLQEGWRDGYGADADHLKQIADVDRCAAAGYTMFTIDPSEHVDAAADTASRSALDAAIAALPWAALDSSWADTRARFSRPVALEAFAVTIAEIDLLRAAAKYGKAIAHTVAMVRRVRERTAGQTIDVEVSVDESATVTTIAEHVYIAAELRRLGVEWTSLAPRYVGEFEKGVDYIGDVAAFEASFAEHLAVARALGPYRLSLHSGSDKFSIFPAAARLAPDVHLKTSGTTYLEALRAVASLEPAIFRDIAALARERYPHDRIGYHVSADRERMPEVAGIPDAALASLLDQFDAREILHVTFGSVIADRGLWSRFLGVLQNREDVYYDALEAHFWRHFAPFGT
jgi:hypothetical protein